MPPKPTLVFKGSSCIGQYENFTVVWNVSFCFLCDQITLVPLSQIPHPPPPPPVYQPFWVNITVEEDDIASDYLLANASFDVNYTYIVVNHTPGAIYTITVSVVNQAGQNESTVTVDTCKNSFLLVMWTG